MSTFLGAERLFFFLFINNGVTLGYVCVCTECYKCNWKGHFKRDCPKLKKSGEGATRSTNEVEIDDSDYYSEGDVLYGSCS